MHLRSSPPLIGCRQKPSRQLESSRSLLFRKRAGGVTRSTCNSSRHSHVFYADERLAMLTTLGSPSLEHWARRSVTSSRYRSAEFTTDPSTIGATNVRGGRRSRLIPFQ